ncbi:MAG: sulfurtransferase TusA family protein [Bradyrhizobium sp.]|nr:MAG: sulfurtransferase TusA family protein [Bradyrhizobium sp.]
MADLTLDLRGLNCPLPILRARKAIHDVAQGGVLEVLATDPLAPEDFASFCETNGHALVECAETEGVFRILIRRAG